MGKTYNIPDFLKYLDIGGSKNDVLHITQFDEHNNMLMRSKPVRIGFYLLAIKRVVDNNIKSRPSDDGMSDYYLYADCPNNFLEWDLVPPVSGYGMFIDGKLFGKHVRNYNFMSYDSHEALFLTKEEKNILFDLFTKAYSEFNKEDFSKEVLVSYASLILSYTQTFYKRQFESRSKMYNKVVADFYEHLDDYFNEMKETRELPSVTYFAEKANLSTNYFGDLIKHFTSNSPSDHIHQYIIQIAKTKLRQTDLSVSEIAYTLGFDYPTYFTRFFRKETGITPTEFRNQ